MRIVIRLMGKAPSWLMPSFQVRDKVGTPILMMMRYGFSSCCIMVAVIRLRGE